MVVFKPPFFMYKIGIIGCGWLAQKWINSSTNHFRITTRTGIPPVSSKNIIETISFDASSETLNVPNWKDCDYIICSIPFSKRNSIVQNQQMALNAISGLINLNKPIIVLSSIGVYTQEKGVIREINKSLNESILTAENHFKHHLRTTILRLGGLMGEDRYLSKYLSEGDNQPVNHIHYQDVIKAIEWVNYNAKWDETYNIVAPEHPTRKEIITLQKTGKSLKDKPNNARIIDSSKIIKQGFTFDKPNPLLYK